MPRDFRFDSRGGFPMLVGLSGRKRSGKNSAAVALDQLAGYVRVAFADDLKALCAAATGIELAAFSDHRKESFVAVLGGALVQPRTVLQAFGEGARKAFGPTFWIDRALATASSRPVAITDVRYLNEVDAVHAAGGLVIRLNRMDRDGPHPFHARVGETTCCYIYLNQSRCDASRTSHPASWTNDRHSSETELPDSGAIYDFEVEADSADDAASEVVKVVKSFLH